MSIKENVVKRSGAAGALLAAFIAVAPQTAVAETGKEPVTVHRYCDEQKAPGANQGEVHLQYSPYKNDLIDVETYSAVHGKIELTNFNCETLIPLCSSGGFAFTKGSLASLHASLGSLNKDDDPIVAKSLRGLANNIEFVSEDFARSSSGVAHLQGSSFPAHGLSLFTSTGPFTIKDGTATDVIKACVDQFRLD